MNDNDFSSKQPSRRDFLKTGAAAVIGTTLSAKLSSPERAFAADDSTLKVGLIGCGGRGTGAANQAMSADKNVVLTAMADVFDDQLQRSLATLKKDEEIRDKIK